MSPRGHHAVAGNGQVGVFVLLRHQGNGGLCGVLAEVLGGLEVTEGRSHNQHHPGLGDLVKVMWWDEEARLAFAILSDAEDL